MKPPLLDLWGARNLFGRSARCVIMTARCDAPRLERILQGRGNASGLSGRARITIGRHRRIVSAILASGHAWIIEDEVEGAMSVAHYDGASDSRVRAA